jgi:hypothetical protein
MPTLGLQTSVCGIDGLTDTDIWSIGEDVAKTRGQALYGRGDIKSNYISEIDLILDIDDTPPRHANIIGWPEKDVEQQQLALKLANQSELKLVPSDPSK